MILARRYRIKDSNCSRYLAQYSWAVNQVWNYCCNIQKEAQRRRSGGLPTRWPREFDLIRLCTGSSKELDIPSNTIQEVCRYFTQSRDAHRKCPRYRASGGPRRALGWVPFLSRTVRIDGSTIRYRKKTFRFWKSRDYESIRNGCFFQDARGHWHISLNCDVTDSLPTGVGEVGIDLGLKALATLSDGRSIPCNKEYRKLEHKLAMAQRAHNRKRIRAIHARIANRRKHHLHVESTKIAYENRLIVIGNVNATKLAKTILSKSVYDASWSTFRRMLEYKASRHQAIYIEVDERWTSATCSACGSRSGPEGIAGLQMRHWECKDCDTSHNRDVNAALNILKAGRERPPLAGEIHS